MAKNRSRRLRKKMHIDEFQELGFSVAWRFPEGTSEEQIDKTVDDFINEVIEPNKLAFDGSGYLAWEGLICMQEIGKCTEEHQAIVRKWLEERKLDEVRTSELFDDGAVSGMPAIRETGPGKNLQAITVSIKSIATC
ncbi:YggL family protein [Escherichia coli]|uniref:YggL family protein n=2 Tax=Gammaproteobacteria TaxID=1236 RepID=UPI0037573789